MRRLLSVAVVGSGPAGLYLTDILLTQLEAAGSGPARVDVYDRLPTPFGLLRYGVAPDHLKMKALAIPLQRTVDHDDVRFLGNVEVGRDVTVEELRERYSAVVYAYGASSDRPLDIPGEDLAGSDSAAEFVRWYSGHPDTLTTGAVLRSSGAVVVGAGNVAIDVARILAKSADELEQTDVPEPVLDALRASPITDVHVLVRRGPAQVRFTNKELHELGELEGVDVVVAPGALELDEETLAEAEKVRTTRHNLETFREWADRPPEGTGAPRRIHLRFWTSPTALEGEEHVERVDVVENQPVAGQTTGAIDAGLVVRCVGYHGLALDGVPFDPDTGTIPNAEGRVLREGDVARHEYAVGWISRGPSGVIGTNKSNAKAVVALMLEDRLPEVPDWDAAAALAERGVQVVTREGWADIDAAETALGEGQGRTRTKLATWEELLAAARG